MPRKAGEGEQARDEPREPSFIVAEGRHDEGTLRTKHSGEGSERSPEVLLFVAEPVFEDRRVVAVVYVVRSTQPVLLELYRIRRGLISVLSVAIVFTVDRPLDMFRTVVNVTGDATVCSVVAHVQGEKLFTDEA